MRCRGLCGRHLKGSPQTPAGLLFPAGDAEDALFRKIDQDLQMRTGRVEKGVKAFLDRGIQRDALGHDLLRRQQA